MRVLTRSTKGTALLLIDVINDLDFEDSEPLVEHAVDAPDVSEVMT